MTHCCAGAASTGSTEGFISVAFPAQGRCTEFIGIFYTGLDGSLAYSTVYPAGVKGSNTQYGNPVSISGTQAGQPTAVLHKGQVYVYYVNPISQQVQYTFAPVQC
jgi:hypothetical protein